MANELMVQEYETSLGPVKISGEDVRRFLVKGRSDYVTEGEIVMFLALCKAQKLNPFVSGEVHLIKYSKDDPAQIVIGYDTYKRRADDNPNFLYKESGIVVQRGNEIVKKEGACLYPTETLIGGWCRVHKVRNDREVVTYKEVSFSEYNKGKSTWKAIPCTMIEKVAISQALREAFPSDYNGLYTAEELPFIEPNGGTAPTPPNEDPVVVDIAITKEQRKQLFTSAHEWYGQEEGNKRILALLAEYGLESTNGMKYSTWHEIMSKLAPEPTVVDADQ